MAHRFPQHVILASYVLCGTAVVSPLLWVSIPALVDYASYLARAAILLAPGASENYVVHWQVIPNLAFDLIAPPIARLVGIETAGRLFIGATMLLPVAAAALLHRALFGRVGLWPLAAFLFVYNYALYFSFLNYLFGLGVALACFAGWIATATWRLAPRIALFALAGVVIYLCHLFAFGLYGLLIGSYETGLLRAGRPLSASMLRRYALVFLQFLPAVALWLANHQAGEPHTIDYGTVQDKISAVLAPMNFHSFGWFLAPVVAALAYLAWRTGSLVLAPSMRWPLLATMACAVAMPATLYGSWAADLRLPVALPFLLVGSLRPARAQPWLARAAIVSAGGFLGTTIVATTLVWQAMDRNYAEFREVSRALPRGVRLMVARNHIPDDWGPIGQVPTALATLDYRSFYHVSNFAIMDRDAFISSFGLQLAPVEPAARNRSLQSQSHTPLFVETLIESAGKADAEMPVDETGLHHDTADWPHKFDYLLFIDYGDPRNPLPALLQPIARGSYFTYYRIAAGRDGPGIE